MHERQPVSGGRPRGPTVPPVHTDGGRRSPDIGDVFDLLSDAHRLRAVRVLLERDVGEPVAVETVAAEVVAAEPDATGTAAPSRPEPTTAAPGVERRVADALRERHLPLLETYGLVDYDEQADRVVPCRRLHLLAEPLKLTDNRVFWRLDGDR